MKKGKFTLAQEKELGTIIDQNIAGVKNENQNDNENKAHTETTEIVKNENENSAAVEFSAVAQQSQSESQNESPLLPSQLNPREARTMIKQMWLDPETYNRCIQAQAARKQQRIPSSFDALAYDALVYYLNALNNA